MRPYGRGPKSPGAFDGNGYCAPRDRGRAYKERQWRREVNLSPDATTELLDEAARPLVELRERLARRMPAAMAAIARDIERSISDSDQSASTDD